ncbi:MAG: sigma-70 family RNA polymerase sigma factor [Anaerolineales bacterium]|nr:sigma-70 family RNA polymerase sigma factor [Anaerolineales bacterium]
MRSNKTQKSKNRKVTKRKTENSSSTEAQKSHQLDISDGIVPLQSLLERSNSEYEDETNPIYDSFPNIDDEAVDWTVQDSNPENERASAQIEEDFEAEGAFERDAGRNYYVGDPDPNDAVALYLKEVSKVPLLSHEEEIALSKRIEAGRAARAKLAEGRTSKEQSKKLRGVVEDGWAAREHLITANFRLVISVAKKYVGRGVPFLDLIQDGNIGLIRATKKFDYRRGYRFSTYATWWIRQAVSRAVADHGRTIRVPVHMGDQINRLRRLTHNLTQNLGREPTIEELAQAMDVTPKKIEELIRVAQRPLSLELPADDQEDNELADYTPDTIIPAPVEKVDEKIMKEHLHRILETLPPRETHILKLRYGLADGKSHTLGEVGRKLGVTRERVRQIEAQALRRLRQPKLQRELQDYLQT